MATQTMKHDANQQDRPSGVPGDYELGESRREGWYVLLALIIFSLIVVGFWFEATR